jgi:hypothetical protein
MLPAPYGSNIPHTQVIPISDRGQTTYLLITFEGTQYRKKLLGYGTHGDLIIMRATQARRGSEFEASDRALPLIMPPLGSRARSC